MNYRITSIAAHKASEYTRISVFAPGIWNNGNVVVSPMQSKVAPVAAKSPMGDWLRGETVLGDPGYFTFRASLQIDNICPKYPCPGPGAPIRSGLLLAPSHTMIAGDRKDSVISSRSPRQNEWLRNRGRGRDRKHVVRASAFLSIDHKL